MRGLILLCLASGLGLVSVPAGGEAAALESCLQAEAAHRAERHEREVELYTRCIEDDRPGRKNLAVAFNNRGVARLASGDTDGALADLGRALELETAYAAAHANRGMAHLARGAYAQSLKDYDRAIELDPAYAPAYAYRCWLLGFMGLGPPALADCEQSLRLRPDHPSTLDSRAFAHWILDDRTSARRDLEMARVLDPRRPAWDARFEVFERRFSVGYPYSAEVIQSAGHAEAREQTSDTMLVAPRKTPLQRIGPR